MKCGYADLHSTTLKKYIAEKGEHRLPATVTEQGKSQGGLVRKDGSRFSGNALQL